MKTRRLGKTGWMVSEIGLGCWQLGGDFGPVDDTTAATILTHARDRGVNFWDTADVYGGGLSESRIGAVLGHSAGTIVATKTGRGDDMFQHGYVKSRVRENIQKSARRLGVDTIDLVQTHTIPSRVMEDGEIFTWLEDFEREGLIRAFGASVETVAEAFVCLRQPRLASLQIIFSLFRQDYAWELLPAAQQADVGIIVRLPLASGLLAGKFAPGHRFPAQDHRSYNADGGAFNVGETFAGLPFTTGVALAEELKAMNATGWPLSQVAIRWILDHPAVTSVIAGVTRPAQLDDNIAASERPALPADLVGRFADFYTSKVRPAVRGSI